MQYTQAATRATGAAKFPSFRAVVPSFRAVVRIISRPLPGAGTYSLSRVHGWLFGIVTLTVPSIYVASISSFLQNQGNFVSTSKRFRLFTPSGRSPLIVRTPEQLIVTFTCDFLKPKKKNNNNKLKLKQISMNYRKINELKLYEYTFREFD